MDSEKKETTINTYLSDISDSLNSYEKHKQAFYANRLSGYSSDYENDSDDSDEYV